MQGPLRYACVKVRQFSKQVDAIFVFVLWRESLAECDALIGLAGARDVTLQNANVALI